MCNTIPKGCGDASVETHKLSLYHTHRSIVGNAEKEFLGHMYVYAVNSKLICVSGNKRVSTEENKLIL